MAAFGDSRSEVLADRLSAARFSDQDDRMNNNERTEIADKGVCLLDQRSGTIAQRKNPWHMTQP
jgi:hypothetical protein